MSVEPSAFLLKEQELMKLNEEINLKTKTALTRSSNNTAANTKLPPTSKVKAKDAARAHQSPKLDAELDVAKILQKAVTQTEKEEDPIRAAPDDLPSPLLQTTLAKPLAKNMQQKPSVNPNKAGCLPEKRNPSLSTEGLVKFLKSKVTILQDEIDAQQKENLKKSEEVQRLQQSFGKLQQQHDQLNGKNNSLQAELQRAQEKIIELELKVKERDNDTVRLGKEGELSRRDFKTMQASAAALEKRLLHAQNEVEALKVNLAGAYDRERETRDQARAEKDCAEKQIKQLRRQRVSLITAYKQQLLLLDNLRRQNLCLEEAKMLEFSEKEFTKILNWEK